MFNNTTGPPSKDDWYSNSASKTLTNNRLEPHLLESGSGPNQNFPKQAQSQYNIDEQSYHHISDSHDNLFKNENAWKNHNTSTNTNELCRSLPPPTTNFVTCSPMPSNTHPRISATTNTTNLNGIPCNLKAGKDHTSIFFSNSNCRPMTETPFQTLTTKPTITGNLIVPACMDNSIPMNKMKNEDSVNFTDTSCNDSKSPKVGSLRVKTKKVNVRLSKEKQKENTTSGRPIKLYISKINVSESRKHIFDHSKIKKVSDERVHVIKDGTCKNASDVRGECSQESPGISHKIVNCDILTDPVSNKVEYLSGRDLSSCDDIENKLAKFYTFQCTKCVQMPAYIGGETAYPTFRSHKQLAEHCKEKHHAKGEVECCGHIMWLRYDLLKHMEDHKTLLRCAQCHKSFSSKVVWKQHMKEHLSKEDTGPYYCQHCDKKFSSKYGLANHLNLHLPEGERPFKCQHCNKGFGAKHAMAKHERTHLPDEERLSFICDKCGKRFGYASTLDGHQKQVHQNERPYVCHVCAKTFPIKGALTYHLTTHETQDRVQCTNCGIWLKNEKILRIHRKCHQGNIFPCPHCDKVSKTRNNLRMHMKRHSNDRPHPCPLCSRAFKTPRDLKTHMVQHTGQKPYSCPFCPKTFASPSNFYAHRKMKHKVTAIQFEESVSSALAEN